jgi:hypothetical protein
LRNISTCREHSIFNTSCDLWTKVRTSFIPNVIGMLSHRQNSHTCDSWQCPGSGEAQSCEHIKFIKILPVLRDLNLMLAIDDNKLTHLWFLNRGDGLRTRVTVNILNWLSLTSLGVGCRGDMKEFFAMIQSLCSRWTHLNDSGNVQMKHMKFSTLNIRSLCSIYVYESFAISIMMNRLGLIELREVSCLIREIEIRKSMYKGNFVSKHKCCCIKNCSLKSHRTVTVHQYSFPIHLHLSHLCTRFHIRVINNPLSWCCSHVNINLTSSLSTHCFPCKASYMGQNNWRTWW